MKDEIKDWFSYIGGLLFAVFVFLFFHIRSCETKKLEKCSKYTYTETYKISNCKLGYCTDYEFYVGNKKYTGSYSTYYSEQLTPRLKVRYFCNDPSINRIVWDETLIKSRW